MNILIFMAAARFFFIEIWIFTKQIINFSLFFEKIVQRIK